jgi:hypothetical protein
MTPLRLFRGLVLLGLPLSAATAQDSARVVRVASCAAAARDSTRGRVEGHVRDAQSDQPIANVRVVLEWSDFTVDRHTGRATEYAHTVTTGTKRDGTFAICDLPTGQAFLMQAQIAERAATGAIEVEIPPGGVLFKSLRIAATKDGAASISGRVERTGSKQPVAGAHVHVFGADSSSVTASDGSFYLNDVPIGTQSIEITSVGLRPRRYAIDVPADGASGLTIELDERVRSLDTIRTVGKRIMAPALRDEFDLRAVHGGTGQYITQAMIERRHPWQTTDMIRFARGFEFVGDTVFSTRGVLEVGGTGRCKPILLIDGSPADSMNEILPIAIHGIEIYATSAGVPPKYPSSDCGAIFIWTK